MPEKRLPRSAKAKANASLTTRTTRSGRRARDEANDDASEHEDIDFNRRIMHEGFRKAFQRVADNYQSNVINPAGEFHKDQLKALNRQMKKSLHPAMPKVVVGQDGWSRRDENNVLDQWDAEKDHWIILDRERYLNLWKICLQFAKCTPWDIVGVNTKLSFGLDGRAGSGEEDEQENHSWSSRFIELLTWLVPHPAWVGSKSSSRSALLGAAIQYAVILRTNDQRAWGVDHFGGEFFSMLDTLCRQDCPCSIAELHAKVRTRMTGSGDATIPIISRVFQSLEKVVHTPTDSYVPSDEEPYDVTTEDLANLIKALDQIVDADTKIKMFLPVEFLYETAKSVRGGRQPPNMDQLDEYHKLALIEEIRRKVKAARSTQSTGGDDVDDADPFTRQSPPAPAPAPAQPTRQRRLSHVSATPSAEGSLAARFSEAVSPPRPSPARPPPASPTQLSEFGLDDGFGGDFGREDSASEPLGSDNESRPPGLGDDSGHNGEETLEPLDDDDAMSVGSIEAMREEAAMAPRGSISVRLGRRIETCKSGGFDFVRR